MAALALAVMVAAPWFVFGVFLPQFITPHTPIRGAKVARSEITPAPVRGRVDVVIVDGLGYDYARQLPELSWLRRRAAMRPLIADYPSYTSPALVSFVTGLGARDNGVRLNGPPQEAIADTDGLAKVARDAGRPIAFYGGGWEPFGALMQAAPDELAPGWLATATRPLVRHGQAAEPGSLEISYVGAVDTAGHRYGGDSTQYRDAAQRCAVWLHGRLSALDFERDVLIIISDHGHIPRGGHGGTEPEALRALLAVIGRGARAGEELPARPLLDVAPTLAALAALPTPAHNVGRPMLDMFAWPPSERAPMLAAPYDQAMRTLCALDPHSPSERRCGPDASLIERLESGQAAAFEEADAALVQARMQRRAQLDERAQSAARMRLSLAVVLLLTALAVGQWRTRAPLSAWLRGASAPLLLLSGYALVLVASGYGPTFSYMPAASDFVKDGVLAGVVALVATLALCRRERLAFARWMLLGVAVPFAILAAYAGVDPHDVPPPYVGVLVFLLSPLLPTAALGSLLLQALARFRPAARR